MSILTDLELCQPTKLATLLRDENEINRGNRIIVVDENGIEEEVESVRGIAIKFYGQNGLVKIPKKIAGKPRIKIHCGEGTFISIGQQCRIAKLTLNFRSKDWTCVIGDQVWMSGYTDIEGNRGSGYEVLVGDRCAIGGGGIWRPTDGHTIYDLNDPETPINSTNFGIHIGSHCWITQHVYITKDAHLPNDVVVAAGAILGNKDFPSNSVVGGVPAKLIREGIGWSKSEERKFEQDIEEMHYKKKRKDPNKAPVRTRTNFAARSSTKTASSQTTMTKPKRTRTVYSISPYQKTISRKAVIDETNQTK